MRAVVVGGGLAGLASAIELTDRGHEVVLLEARPTLGGAVQTLPARRGDPVPPPDNGQHIALGACTAYLRFVERVAGAGALRRERLSLPVFDEGGRMARLAAGARGLLRYRHLTLTERVRVVRVARRLAALEPASLDDESFGDLVRRLGGTTRELERFWDVFIRPALNLRSDEASAALAVFTVREGLFGEQGAADLLLPVRPLGEMHGSAANEFLARAGARVRTGTRVTGLDREAAVLADGERVAGDVFVIALPPQESADLLEEPGPKLEDSPIVSVHLLFDRPLLREPLAAFLGSPAHWVFDRGCLTGTRPERGQYLTVVSSGAPDLLEVRGRELVALMAGELTGRLGPAELLWSRVSREPSATFAGRPGTARLRAGVETSRAGVARAGAWTDTGWPATMEGAVRSGIAAVDQLLSDKATMVVT